MPRKKSRTRAVRHRVGRVSYYEHHGAWHIYYRDGQQQIRRKAGATEDDAERVAAQINAQLSAACPTPFSFTPVSVAELRRRFLQHHEQVLSSLIGTIRRYRAATQHLVAFACEQPAHEIDAERFAGWLRTLKVSPNGHAKTAKRPLRDKGRRYILEVCRSLYAYAAKRRFLPPYAENPFSKIDLERMQVQDAKPIFVFDQHTELKFLQTADRWTFPIQFTLAKAGLRPGELVHLLVEDVDLKSGWLFVRNKTELGWRIKTGRERPVPLIDELVEVLRHVIGNRNSGAVFTRHHFDPQKSPLNDLSQPALLRALATRLAAAESALDVPLSREHRQKIARTVWRDAGAIRADVIRTTFIRTALASGLSNATCPKSWRHSFATQLQDANVDPLIRQITLGHKPSDDARGELGMTAVYTHTRATTQKREIERALRLWPASLDLARQWVIAAKNPSIGS